MPNFVKFNDLAAALDAKTLEPTIEIIGLASSDAGAVHLNLDLEGEDWVKLAGSDVDESVEFFGQKQVGDAKHTFAKFQLTKSASSELMWAVIHDLQRSLDSAKAAYKAEVESHGGTVMMGDSLAEGDCKCNYGDKCCCPPGFKCCNHDKRCCCKSG